MSEDKKAILVVFSPVAGIFLPQTPAVKAVLDAMRAEITDPIWKQGYTPEKSKAVLAALEKEGISILEPAGTLEKVRYQENIDTSGNVYRKVQVILKDDLLQESYLISLEAKDEISQLIIQNLLNCKPGEYLSFATKQESRDAGSRVYYNHRPVIVRNVDGKDEPIFPRVGCWKAAQEAADVAAAPLMALNNPSLKESINKLKADTKIGYHLGLLKNEIEPLFV